MLRQWSHVITLTFVLVVTLAGCGPRPGPTPALDATAQWKTAVAAVQATLARAQAATATETVSLTGGKAKRATETAAAQTRPATNTPAPSKPLLRDAIVLIEVSTITGKGSRTRHMFTKDGGGTDDDVYLILEGVSQTGIPYSRQFALEDPSKNDREQGQTDYYRISGGGLALDPISLSALKRVGFRKEETSQTTKIDGDWLLQGFSVSFTLADGTHRSFEFRPNQWFSSGEMAQFTWPLQ